MAKRNADLSLTRSAEPLYQEIRVVLESARAGAYRAVNAAMVQAYWHVGRLIVENEQGGAKRAAYGEAVLEELSRRLTAEFGRGFDVTNLRKMRQFYRMFEIRDAVRLESGKTKRDAVRLVSLVETSRHTASDGLSWSHFRLLMQVEDPAAREWYMREAADQHWSTRQLERQISVLYYERLLASRKKEPVRKEAAAKLAKTIGLLLCSRKNEAIAKYSVLSENRQIFAAKYVKVLPTEGELTQEIERERRLIDARHVDE